MQNPKYELMNGASKVPIRTTYITRVTENKPTNFKFKVLQPYFEEEFSSHEPRSIALECLRRVKCRKECAREVPVFADTVRNFVTYIHNYNMTVLKSSSVYPYCEEFLELLHQYVLLECQILYKIPYYSKVREIQVQTRILRLLINIYTDYFQSKMIPSKEVREKSAKAIFDIFVQLKLNYPNANYKILENMTVILLKRIGRYEKINALKGKCVSSVNDPDLSIFSTNVISSGYGTDESSNERTTQPSINIDVEEGTSSGHIIKEESDNLIESTRNPNSKLVWTVWLGDEGSDDDINFLGVEIESKRKTKNNISADAKSISENVVRKDKEKKYTTVSSIKPKSGDSLKKSTNKTAITNILKANYLSDRLNQLDAILDSVNKEETDDEYEDSKPDLQTLLIKKETRKIDVDSGTNNLPKIQTNVSLKMADKTPLVRIPSFNNRLKATNQNMETIIEIEEDEEDKKPVITTTRIQETPKLIDIIDLIDSDDNEEEEITPKLGDNQNKNPTKISNLNTNPDPTKPVTSENIEANEDANDVSSSSLILTLQKFESKCDNGISTTTAIENLTEDTGSTDDDVTVQMKNEETVVVPDSSKLLTNENKEENILTEEEISGVEEDSFTGRNISQDRLTDKHDHEESTIEKGKLVPINEKEEIVAEEDELPVNDTNNVVKEDLEENKSVQATKEEEENKLVQANSEEIIDEDHVQISNLHLTTADKIEEIFKPGINEEMDKEDLDSSSINDINNKEIKENELIETNDTEETLKDKIEDNTEEDELLVNDDTNNVVVKEENKSIQTTKKELKVITEKNSVLEEIIDEDPAQMSNLDLTTNSTKLKNYEEIVESIITEESKDTNDTEEIEETLKDSMNIQDFENANEHLDKNKITETNNSEEMEVMTFIEGNLVNLNEEIEETHKDSINTENFEDANEHLDKNKITKSDNSEEMEVVTFIEENLVNLNEEIEDPTKIDQSEDKKDLDSSSTTDINNQKIEETNVDFEENKLIETNNTEEIEVTTLNDPNLQSINEEIEETIGEINTNIEYSRSSSITDINNEDIEEKDVDFKENELIETKNTEDIEEIVITEENEVYRTDNKEDFCFSSSTDINNEEIEVKTNLENINGDNEEIVARDINLENNEVDQTEKIEESNADLEENELISEEIEVTTLNDAQLENINEDIEETVILEENKEDIEESNADLEENELISEEIEVTTLNDAQLENINEDIEETVILEENKEDIEESNADLEENELISEEIEVTTLNDAQLENINEDIEEIVILEENKEDIEESNADLEENELISEEIEVTTLNDAQLENINEDIEETVILEENKEDIEEKNETKSTEAIEDVQLNDPNLENITEYIEEIVITDTILDENEVDQTDNKEDFYSEIINKEIEETVDPKNAVILEENELIESKNIGPIEEHQLVHVINKNLHSSTTFGIVKDDTENAIISEENKSDLHSDSANEEIEETNLHYEETLIETNNNEKNEDVNSISTYLEDTNEEEDLKINNELVQTNDSEDLVVEDLIYRNNEEIIEAQIINEDHHLETCDTDFTQIENTQQSDKGEDKIDANIYINTEKIENKLYKSETMPEEEEEETKDENVLSSREINRDIKDGELYSEDPMNFFVQKYEEFPGQHEEKLEETEELIETEGILCKPLEEYTKFEKQMLRIPHNTINETPVVQSEHSKMFILAIVAEMKRESEETSIKTKKTPRKRRNIIKSPTKLTKTEERRITRSVSKNIFESILRPQDFKTTLSTANVTIHQLPESDIRKTSTDNDSSDNDSDNMLFIDEKEKIDNEKSIYDEDSLEENLQFSYESRIRSEPAKKSKTKSRKLKTMAERKSYNSPYVVIERLDSKDNILKNPPPEDPDVILTKLPKKLQLKYSKKSPDNNLEQTTIINKSEEIISNSSIALNIPVAQEERKSPTLPAKLRNKRGNSIMIDTVKIDLSNCKNPVKTIAEKLGKRLENEIKIGFIDIDRKIPTPLAADPDDVPLTLRLQNKDKVSENASLHPKKNIKRVSIAPKIEKEENLQTESSSTNTSMNESEITPCRRSFTYDEPEIDELIAKYTECEIVHSTPKRTNSGSVRSSRSKSCTTKHEKIDEVKKSRSKSLTDRCKKVQTVSHIGTAISEDDLTLKRRPVDPPKIKEKHLRSTSSIDQESKELVQTVTDSSDICRDNLEIKFLSKETSKTERKRTSRSSSLSSHDNIEVVQTVSHIGTAISKDDLTLKRRPVDPPKIKEKHLRSTSSIDQESKELVQTVTDSSDICRDNLEIKFLSKEPSKTERKRTSRSSSLSSHDNIEVVQTVSHIGTAISEDDLTLKRRPVDPPKIKEKHLRSTSSIDQESKELVQTVTDSSDICRDNLEIKFLSKETSKTERKRTSRSSSLSSHDNIEVVQTVSHIGTAISKDDLTLKRRPVDPPKIKEKHLRSTSSIDQESKELVQTVTDSSDICRDNLEIKFLSKEPSKTERKRTSRSSSLSSHDNIEVVQTVSHIGTAISEDDLTLKRRPVDPPKIKEKHLRFTSSIDQESKELVQTVTDSSDICRDNLEIKFLSKEPSKTERKRTSRSSSLSSHDNIEVVQTVSHIGTAISEDDLTLKRRPVDPPKIKEKHLRSTSSIDQESKELVQTVTDSSDICRDNLEIKFLSKEPSKTERKRTSRSSSLSSHDNIEVVQTVSHIGTAISEDDLTLKRRPVDPPKIKEKHLRSTSSIDQESKELVQTVTDSSDICRDNLEIKFLSKEPSKTERKRTSRSSSLSSHDNIEVVQTVSHIGTAISEDDLTLKRRPVDPPKIKEKHLRSTSSIDQESKELVQTVTDSSDICRDNLEVKTLPKEPSKTDRKRTSRSSSLSSNDNIEVVQTVSDTRTAINEDTLELKSRHVDPPKIKAKNLRSSSSIDQESKELVQTVTDSSDIYRDNLEVKTLSKEPSKTDRKRTSRSSSLSSHDNIEVVQTVSDTSTAINEDTMELKSRHVDRPKIKGKNQRSTPSIAQKSKELVQTVTDSSDICRDNLEIKSLPKEPSKTERKRTSRSSSLSSHDNIEVVQTVSDTNTAINEDTLELKSRHVDPPKIKGKNLRSTPLIARESKELIQTVTDSSEIYRDNLKVKTLPKEPSKTNRKRTSRSSSLCTHDNIEVVQTVSDTSTAINEDTLELISRHVDPPKIKGKNQRSTPSIAQKSKELVQTVTDSSDICRDNLEIKSLPKEPSKTERKRTSRSSSLSSHDNIEVVQTVSVTSTAINEDTLELKSRHVDPLKINGKNQRSTSSIAHKGKELVQTVTDSSDIYRDNLEVKTLSKEPSKTDRKRTSRSSSLSSHDNIEVVQTVSDTSTAINEDTLELKSRHVDPPKIKGKNLRSTPSIAQKSKELVQTVTDSNDDIYRDNLEVKTLPKEPSKTDKKRTSRLSSLSSNDNLEVVQTVSDTSTAINEKTLELKSRHVDPPKIKERNLRSTPSIAQESKELVQTVTDSSDIYRDNLEVKTLSKEPSKTDRKRTSRSSSLSSHDNIEVVQTVSDTSRAINEDTLELESRHVDLPKINRKNLRSTSSIAQESKELVQTVTIMNEDNLEIKTLHAEPSKTERKRTSISGTLSSHDNLEVVQTVSDTSTAVDEGNSHPVDPPKAEGKNLRSRSLSAYETKEIVQTVTVINEDNLVLKSPPVDPLKIKGKNLRSRSLSGHESNEIVQTVTAINEDNFEFKSGPVDPPKIEGKNPRSRSLNTREGKETVQTVTDTGIDVYKDLKIKSFPAQPSKTEGKIRSISLSSHDKESVQTVSDCCPIIDEDYLESETSPVEQKSRKSKSVSVHESKDLSSEDNLDPPKSECKTLRSRSLSVQTNQSKIEGKKSKTRSSYAHEPKEIIINTSEDDLEPKWSPAESRIENSNESKESVTNSYPLQSPKIERKHLRTKSLTTHSKSERKSVNTEKTYEERRIGRQSKFISKRFTKSKFTRRLEKVSIRKTNKKRRVKENIAEVKETNEEIREIEVIVAETIPTLNDRSEEALTTVVGECPITQNENLVIEEENITEKSSNMDSSPEKTIVEVIENKNHHEEALTTVVEEFPVSQNENLVIEEENITEKSSNMDSSPKKTIVEVIENKNHHEEALTTVVEEFPVPQNENVDIEEEENSNKDSSAEKTNVEVIQNENYHKEALTTVVEEFPVSQNENLEIENVEIAENSLNMDSLEKTNVEVIENENHHKEALTTVVEEFPLTQNENLGIEEEKIAENSLNMDSSEKTNVEVIENENHHEEALTTDVKALTKVVEEFPVTQNENLEIEEEEIAENSLNIDSSEKTNVEFIENENHHEEALTTDVKALTRVVEEFPVTHNENLDIEEEENSNKDSSAEKTNVEVIENENHHKEALTTVVEEFPVPQNENLEIEEEKIPYNSLNIDSSEKTNVKVIENENHQEEALTTFVEECPITRNENLEIKEEKVAEKSLNVTKNVESEDVVCKEQHNSAFAEPVYEKDPNPDNLDQNIKKINDSPLENVSKKVTTSDLIKKLRGQQKKSKKRTKKNGNGNVIEEKRSSENKLSSSDAYLTQPSSDTTKIERNSSVLSVDNNNSVQAAVLPPKTNEMEGLIDNKSETKSSLLMDHEELQNVEILNELNSEVNEMDLIDNTNEQNSSLKDIKSSLVLPVKEKEEYDEVPKELEHLELSTHIDNQKTDYTQLLTEIPTDTIIDDKKSNSSLILHVETKEDKTSSLILPVPNKELEHTELLSIVPHIENEQPEYTQLLTEIPTDTIIDDKKSNSSLILPVETKEDETSSLILPVPNKELEHTELLSIVPHIENEQPEYTQLLTEIPTDTIIDDKKSNSSLILPLEAKEDKTSSLILPVPNKELEHPELFSIVPHIENEQPEYTQLLTEIPTDTIIDDKKTNSSLILPVETKEDETSSLILPVPNKELEHPELLSVVPHMKNEQPEYMQLLTEIPTDTIIDDKKSNSSLILPVETKEDETSSLILPVPSKELEHPELLSIVPHIENEQPEYTQLLTEIPTDTIIDDKKILPFEAKEDETSSLILPVPNKKLEHPELLSIVPHIENEQPEYTQLLTEIPTDTIIDDKKSNSSLILPVPSKELEHPELLSIVPHIENEQPEYTQLLTEIPKDTIIDDKKSNSSLILPFEAKEDETSSLILPVPNKELEHPELLSVVPHMKNEQPEYTQLLTEITTDTIIDDKKSNSSLILPFEAKEDETSSLILPVPNKELEHPELLSIVPHMKNEQPEYTQLLTEIPTDTIIDDKKSNSSLILPVETKEDETSSLILPVPNKELEHPELLSIVPHMKNEQPEYTQLLTGVSAKISEIENFVEDDTQKSLIETEDEKRDYTEVDDILTRLDEEIRKMENAKNQVTIQRKEVFDHNRFFTQPKGNLLQLDQKLNQNEDSSNGDQPLILQIGDLLKIKENCNVSKQSSMSSNKDKKMVKKRKQFSSSAEPLCKKYKSSATEENNAWEVPNASFDNSYNQLIPYPMVSNNNSSGEELTEAISLTDSTSKELYDRLPSDIVEFLKTYVRMYPNNNNNNVNWNPPPAISIVSSHTTYTTISNYPMAENNLFSPEQNKNGGFATITSKKEITFNYFNGPYNQNANDPLIDSQGFSANDNLATDHCYSQAAQTMGNSNQHQLKAITSGTNDHTYNTGDPLMSMGYGNNIFGLEEEESLNRRGLYSNWDIEPKVIVVPNEQYNVSNELKDFDKSEELIKNTEFKTPDGSLVDEDWEETEEFLKNTQTPVENGLVSDQWVESVPIKNIEVEIPFANHENSCSIAKEETYDSADNLYSIILNNATSVVPQSTATPLIPDLWNQIPFDTETPHELVTDQWPQNNEVKNLSFYTTHFTDTEESNHSEEPNPVEDIPNSEPSTDITPVQDNVDADTSSSKTENDSGVSSKIKQLMNLHKKIQNKNQSVSKSKQQNLMVIPSRQYSRTIPSDWTKSSGTGSPVLASKTDKPADPTHNEDRESSVKSEPLKSQHQSVITDDSSSQNKRESLVKRELLMGSHKSAIADLSIENKKDLLEVVKKQEIGRRSPRIYEQNESKRSSVKSEAKQNNATEESSSVNKKDSLQVTNTENKKETVIKNSEAKNDCDNNSNRSDINKNRNTTYIETNRTKPVTAKEISHSNGIERLDEKLVASFESSAKDKRTTRSKVSLSDTKSSKYVSVDSTLGRKLENVSSNRRLAENKFDEKSYLGSSDSPQSASDKSSPEAYSNIYDTVKSRKRLATKKPIENTVESYRLRRKATPDIQSSYGKTKTYFDYNKPLGNSSNGKHYSNSGSSSGYHSVDNGGNRDERNYQKDPKKSKRPACDEFNDKRKIQKTEDFDGVYDKLWSQGNINPHLKFPHKQTGTNTSKNQRYETLHSGHKRSSSEDLNYGGKRRSSGSSSSNYWKNGDRGTSKGPQRYSSFRPPSDSIRSHQESSHLHPESRSSYPSYPFRDNREPNYFPRNSSSSSNKMPPTVSPSNRPSLGSGSSSRTPPTVYNSRAPPSGSSSSSRAPPSGSSSSRAPPPGSTSRAPPPGSTSRAPPSGSSSSSNSRAPPPGSTSRAPPSGSSSSRAPPPGSTSRTPHIRPTTRAPPAGYTFGTPPTASNRSQVPIFPDVSRSQAPNSHSNASPDSSHRLSEEKQSKLLEDLKKYVQNQTQKSKTKNKNPSNLEWYQQMGTILSETDGSLGMNRRD